VEKTLARVFPLVKMELARFLQCPIVPEIFRKGVWADYDGGRGEVFVMIALHSMFGMFAD